MTETILSRARYCTSRPDLLHFKTASSSFKVRKLADKIYNSGKVQDAFFQMQIKFAGRGFSINTLVVPALNHLFVAFHLSSTVP